MTKRRVELSQNNLQVILNGQLSRVTLKISPRHKGWMLLPAVAWLFIQFSMSGIMLGSSANAMEVEICSPFGVQTISIDPETGEPVEQSVGSGCDWCQSFGVMADMAMRDDVAWSALDRDHKRLLPVLAPMIGPMRLVAGFQSRAPPTL